nr:pescadillo homolog [Ipomoea batatas]
MSKKNKDLAECLLNRKPTYTLDRITRDRHPKLIDALRDLDDCLNSVYGIRWFLLGTCHLVDNEAEGYVPEYAESLRPSSGYRPLQEKKSLPMQGVRWHRGFG